MKVEETFFRRALSPFGDLIFAFLAVLMLEPLVKNAAADHGAGLPTYCLHFAAIFGIYLFWRQLSSVVAPDNLIGNACVLAALMASPLCAYTLVHTPRALAAREASAGMFYIALAFEFASYAVAVYADPSRKVSSQRFIIAIVVGLCLMLMGCMIWSNSASAVAAMFGITAAFYLLLVLPAILWPKRDAMREVAMESGYN